MCAANQPPVSLLDQIDSPDDLQDLNLRQLEDLAEELRQRIIDSVEKVGGHLAPSLGWWS